MSSCGLSTPGCGTWIKVLINLFQFILCFLVQSLSFSLSKSYTLVLFIFTVLLFYNRWQISPITPSVCPSLTDWLTHWQIKFWVKRVVSRGLWRWFTNVSFTMLWCRHIESVGECQVDRFPHRRIWVSRGCESRTWMYGVYERSAILDRDRYGNTTWTNHVLSLQDFSIESVTTWSECLSFSFSNYLAKCKTVLIQ